MKALLIYLIGLAVMVIFIRIRSRWNRPAGPRFLH